MFVGINLGINLRSSVSFSPSALFAAGEPGVWFDPSDVANLDWRVNLLLYSEQFDNAYWAKAAGVTITPNTHIAPDGTMTADTLTSSANQISSSFILSISASTTYTNSVYFRKTVGATYTPGMYLIFTGGTTAIYAAVVNTNTGVPTAVTAGGFTAPSNISVTEVGDYWRLSVSGGSNNNFELRHLVYPNFNPVTSAAGAGTQVIWGAQTEVGPVATTYQPITTVDEGTLARFPNATLYRDLEGTSPVTTPSQTVALMLDKSKGLARGPELVGTFSAYANATFSTAGGVTTVTCASNGSYGISLGFSGVAGTTYAMTFEVLSNSASRVLYGWTSISSSFLINAGTATGVKSGSVFTSANGSGVIAILGATAGETFSIRNISVKEILGNHATQTTPAARPNYAIEPAGGRRNILTFSEQFDNAVWAKDSCTVVSNTTLAPDGTTTADRIVSAAATVQIGVGQGLLTTPTAVAHTASYYVQANGARYVQLLWSTSLSTNYANFDLQNPTAPTAGTYTGATITPAANGFYRITITSTLAAAAGGTFLWFVDSGTAARAAAYTGNGTSGAFIWGAQLELGSTATPYQKVTTQYDVTEAGKASMSYLYFDGTDDGMVTSTITPGIDKVQTFAGVRKLSDNLGVVAELGPVVNSNAGTFFLGTYTGQAFGSTGTTYRDALFSPVANPNTSVLTGLGDISGDLATLRANGSQIAQNTGDQGTGNYNSHVLNIGRRNNTAAALFTGHIYSLITRFGPNLPANTITSTERWVAGETGFYPPIITGVPTIGVS